MHALAATLADWFAWFCIVAGVHTGWRLVTAVVHRLAHRGH